jgi:hypothetical protein
MAADRFCSAVSTACVNLPRLCHYASVFPQMFPKETTPSDIYSDAQLARLCDAIEAKLEKAVRNGNETIH